MNVLSLFDGISAGRVALDRAGIDVGTYYASEIDKYAIKISEANYPDIVRLGDVTNWREWDIDWASIDLLIGGSPCQGFSFAGKQLAFDDPRSALFFVYADILNHIKSVNPNVKFLLENVKMKKEFLDVISEHLGVEPVFINSALVSAQNRQRYYWANWEFGQPEDKGIMLADILEDVGFDTVQRLSDNKRVKGITENARGIRPHRGDDRKTGISELGRILKPEAKNTDALTSSHAPKVIVTSAGRNISGDRVLRSNGDKSPSITARYYKGVKSDGAPFVYSGSKQKGDIFDYKKDRLNYRKLTPIECERLQTFPDNFTAHVSNTQRYKALGNSWTVDVIVHILKQGSCKSNS